MVLQMFFYDEVIDTVSEAYIAQLMIDLKTRIIHPWFSRYVDTPSTENVGTDGHVRD